MEDPEFTWFELPPGQALRVEFPPTGVLVPGDRGYQEIAEDTEHEQWLTSGLPAEEWRAAQGREPLRVTEAKIPEAVGTVEIPERALAVSRKQAAALLGVGLDTFRDQVLPHIRVVQLDRRQLIPVRELERYMNEHAAFALKGQR